MIICGFIKDSLHPKAKASFPPEVELLDFTGNEFAYWQAIYERWTGEEDIIVLEQDIEITPDVISSFENCERLWCTFEFDAIWRPHPSAESEPRVIRDALGCARFRAEAQRRTPMTGPWSQKIPWRILDRHMSVLLRVHGMEPHVHGKVRHHHSYTDIM